MERVTGIADFGTGKTFGFEEKFLLVLKTKTGVEREIQDINSLTTYGSGTQKVMLSGIKAALAVFETRRVELRGKEIFVNPKEREVFFLAREVSCVLSCQVAEGSYYLVMGVAQEVLIGHVRDVDGQWVLREVE